MTRQVFARLRSIVQRKKVPILTTSPVEDEYHVNEHQEKVIKKLKGLSRHKNIRLTSRGNDAIFTALAVAKKVNPRPTLLIPDQGGWISFKRYPLMFNFGMKEVKTDYGVVDLDDLKVQSENASAFIFTSFAGYIAEQPLRKIAKICKANNCLIIEDASGAVGDKKLCNGKYSNIVVGSFGKGGPINYGYGGFISTNNQDHFNAAKEVFSMVKVHPNFYKEILPFLNNKRLKNILLKAEEIKEELKNFEVIHKNERGLNVTVKFDAQTLPKLLKYCDEKSFPYMLCPDYTRVNEKAISIEVKKLEFPKK